MGTVSGLYSLSSLLAYISILTTTRRLVSENAATFCLLETQVSSRPQPGDYDLGRAARLQGPQPSPALTHSQAVRPGHFLVQKMG